jgi:hypothetical protein
MNAQEPDIALAMSDNPADRALYIQQDRAHKHMLAQRDNAQRDAEKGARPSGIKFTSRGKPSWRSRKVPTAACEDELPEILDPSDRTEARSRS